MEAEEEDENEGKEEDEQTNYSRNGKVMETI